MKTLLVLASLMSTQAFANESLGAVVAREVEGYYRVTCSYTRTDYLLDGGKTYVSECRDAQGTLRATVTSTYAAPVGINGAKLLEVKTTLN